MATIRIIRKSRCLWKCCCQSFFIWIVPVWKPSVLSVTELDLGFHGWDKLNLVFCWMLEFPNILLGSENIDKFPKVFVIYIWILSVSVTSALYSYCDSNLCISNYHYFSDWMKISKIKDLELVSVCLFSYFSILLQLGSAKNA